MTLRRLGLLTSLCATACLLGCGTRTIYIKAGEPVMLRQTVKGAKVWVKDAKGNLTPGILDLAEGWWCLEDVKR